MAIVLIDAGSKIWRNAYTHTHDMHDMSCHTPPSIPKYEPMLDVQVRLDRLAGHTCAEPTGARQRPAHTTQVIDQNDGGQSQLLCSPAKLLINTVVAHPQHRLLQCVVNSHLPQLRPMPLLPPSSSSQEVCVLMLLVARHWPPASGPLRRLRSICSLTSKGWCR
jgi:hypothetical protein